MFCSCNINSKKIGNSFSLLCYLEPGEGELWGHLFIFCPLLSFELQKLEPWCEKFTTLHINIHIFIHLLYLKLVFGRKWVQLICFGFGSEVSVSCDNSQPLNSFIHCISFLVILTIGTIFSLISTVDRSWSSDYLSYLC